MTMPAKLEAGQAAGLADRLRQATASLHVEAEGSGIVADLLHGRASRLGHALFLRNLLPAYRRLEAGLEAARRRPSLALVAQPALYRREALESDLRRLCGEDWPRSLPLLPSGSRYERRVAWAARGDGLLLLAHAYTRYLGDLNGGRVLRRLLEGSLALPPDALRFYDYPGVEDPRALARDYRDALDAAGATAPAVSMAKLAREARAAFALNIDVSREVQRFCAGAGRAG